MISYVFYQVRGHETNRGMKTQVSRSEEKRHGEYVILEKREAQSEKSPSIVILQ